MLHNTNILLTLMATLLKMCSSLLISVLGRLFFQIIHCIKIRVLAKKYKMLAFSNRAEILHQIRVESFTEVCNV